MLRHLAASWLFAGFLVVVAVATWRLIDARRPDPVVRVVRSEPAPPPPSAPLPSFAKAVIDGGSYGSTPFDGPRKLDLDAGMHELRPIDETSGAADELRATRCAGFPVCRACFAHVSARADRGYGSIGRTAIVQRHDDTSLPSFVTSMV